MWKFDTIEELNAAAAAIKETGNAVKLKELAADCGLDKTDAEDYMDGTVEEFATLPMAVNARIGMESKELKIAGVLADWRDTLLTECTEDQELCKGALRITKTLKGYMAAVIRLSFGNKVQVSDEIVKATKVLHDGKEEQLRGPLYMGVPNKAQLRQIIREYYCK